VPHWLDRLMNRPEPVKGPPPLLADYPAYLPPNAGPPERWTLAQARENLAFLLAQKQERLQILSRLLKTRGIDIEPALGGGDIKPLLADLQRWAIQDWQAMRGPMRPPLATWLGSSRAGSDIVYSMLTDVGILLGELVMQRRSTIHWGLDGSEEGAAEKRVTYRRPVLMARSARTGRDRLVLDVEAMAYQRFAQIDSPTERVIDPWVTLIDGAIAGGYET
jgi:hypothetical protein